jgi:hypothetical protein
MPNFKEASFIEGRLIRVTKKTAEIEVQDDESGEPALATVKLSSGVSIDLAVVGEKVRAVIVDGKIARIVPIPTSTVHPGDSPTRVSIKGQ